MEGSLNQARVHSALARGVTVLLAALMLVAAVRLTLGALAFLHGPLLELWGFRAELDPLRLPPMTRLTWVGIGLGAALLSVGLFWIGLGGLRSKERWFVLANRRAGGRGSSTISLAASAARALIAETAAEIPGVWELHPELRLSKKGWEVECLLFVRRDEDLLEIAAEVEQTISETLRQHTGIGLARYRARTRIGPYEPKIHAEGGQR